MSKEKRNQKQKRRLIKDPKPKMANDCDLGIDGKVLAAMTISSILGNIIAPRIGGLLAGGLIGSVVGASHKKEKKMARIPVFYSFHFNNDVMRVQQVRNIGSIEGNPPTSPNEWEQLKRTGPQAVQNWIDQNMKHKRCVIVLIGSETASRPWINYEIEKAWKDGRALLGIHIHNLRCPRSGTCRKGKNPFDEFTFQNGSKLSSVIPCYDPSPVNAYGEIAANIANWINLAIANKRN